MVVKGKPLTLKEQWQKLVNELKDMTPQQKLEHLWEYYKWVLGVLAGFILIVCTVVAAIISLNTETIIAGTIINVPVSPDGYVYLQEGYYEHAKTEGRQQVELTNMNFVNPYTTVDQTYASNVMENVTAMIASDVLDYVMYDDEALPFFISPEMFTDLRNLFTEEELAAMGNAVIRLKIEETGEEIPIAIDIRDTEFYNTYMDVEKNIYLSFSVRLPRKEACRDFWQFIKGGKTDGLQTMLAGTVVDAPVTDEGLGYLQKDFFKARGYTLGDHRVELTQQSFLPAPDAEGEDPSQAIQADVRARMADGRLDYVLCGKEAFDLLEQGSMLDLGTLLTPEQLKKLGGAVVYTEDGVPVALDVSGLSFGKKYVEGDVPVYLVISGASQRTECVSAFLSYVNP